MAHLHRVKVFFTTVWGALLLCGLFICGAGWVARSLPTVNTDEVFLSVMGLSVVEGAGPKYSLYEDVFDPSIYGLQNCFSTTTSPYLAWVGLWVKVLGKSYWAARLSSVVAGGLALFIYFLIGCRLNRPGLGLSVLSLLLLNPVYWMASCLVRPEIFLFLSTGLIIWLMHIVPERAVWKEFLLGFWITAQVTLHPNALVLIPGLVLIWESTLSPNRVWEKRIWGFLGLSAGGVAWLSSMDFQAGQMLINAFWYELLRPPLITFPWRPWQWVWETLHAFFIGQTFYVQTSAAPGWGVSLACHWTGLGICAAGFFVLRDRKKPVETSWVRAFAWGLFLTLGGMMSIMKKKELLYAVPLLYPFLLPLAGFFWLQKPPRGIPRTQSLRFMAAIAVLGGCFSFVSFSRTYLRQSIPYAESIRQVREFCKGTDLKVLGPNLLWFAWDSEHFRDIGALTFSRWFNGGHRDLQAWTQRWRPDLMIVDPTARRTFFGPGVLEPRLTRELRHPVRLLGLVKAGLEVDGALEIYQVDWSKNSDGSKTRS